MDNFYQSDIWRTINSSIFQKPIFEINLFGKKHFGTIKKKTFLGQSFQWFQVMGIYSGINTFTINDQLKTHIYNIYRDYGSSFGNIMFQFGFIDPIITFPVQNLKSIEFVSKVKAQREEINDYFSNSYSLKPSFRENMPLSTIVFDLSSGYDDLLKSMSKSARAHIKKGISRNLKFSIALSKNEWDEFYDVWADTSKDKGFNIFPKSTFDKLKNFLNPKTTGNLFLAKLDGKIVSGSICIFVGDTIVYMYGATNRQFGNVGGHQFLKNEMFKRGISKGFKSVDLLGTSPTGFPDHHLSGVTKFKESLGGNKIEYYGNFDCILNPLLYSSFKLIKS